MEPGQRRDSFHGEVPFEPGPKKALRVFQLGKRKEYSGQGSHISKRLEAGGGGEVG